VKLLLRVGADPSKRDMVGATPLHWAASVRSVDKVKLLLDAGADVHAMTKVDYTPLHFLLVRELLRDSMGADIRARGDFEEVAVHCAAVSRFVGVMRAVLEAGGSGMEGAGQGWTPLHYAARYGTPGIVRRLVKAGADPYVKDRSGRTPL
ncbi:hypothetical protein BOTBODRAFT_86602, partial [Botryobasidium botryosum FD-172 SS1]